MARLPVIPNCFRVAIKHAGGDTGHTVNVVHVLTGAEAGTDAVWTALNTAIAGKGPFTALHTSFTETGLTVSITKLDGVTPTKDYTSTDGAWAGSSGGDPIPEAAMGLTLRTDKRGKSYRGRVFIGPITETFVNMGVISAAVSDDTTAQWTAWANALVAIGPTFCVASYRHATAEPVTHIEGHREVRTQRQRLVRLR